MSARVLITDGETRSALAAMRGLCAAGFETDVAAADSTRPAPSHWSRYPSERITVPHPLRDEPGFVAALERQLVMRPCSLVLPGSDASLLALSRARERLARTGALLGLPPHELVEQALDKLVLVRAAQHHALDSPTTVLCSGTDEGLEAARTLGFPVLVKPRRSIVERGAARIQMGSVRAGDEASLTAAIAACGDPHLIQQAEQGIVVSFAGVYAGGDLLGEAFSRYRRTWYPDAGNVSFSETDVAPAELRTKLMRLLEELRWEGIFELELLERAPDTWAAIDFNPRPYGSLALAIEAGANLPALWARYLLAGETASARARPGLRYRWEDADLRHALWQLRRARLHDAGAALAIQRRVVHPSGCAIPGRSRRAASICSLPVAGASADRPRPRPSRTSGTRA